MCISYGMTTVRVFVKSAIAAAALWLIACGVLIVFARSFIYPFVPGISADETVGIPGARAVELRAADGTALTV